MTAVAAAGGAAATCCCKRAREAAMLARAAVRAGSDMVGLAALRRVARVERSDGMGSMMGEKGRESNCEEAQVGERFC